MLGGRTISSARLAIDEHDISQEERQFWSFQPITHPPIPPIDGSRAQNPIDAFIAQQHQAHHLATTQLLESGMLIRRVTFDLIGLPPTPQQVGEFSRALAENPQTAYVDLVERLLASKEYGERWAQHWLDLVRYADTAGDAADYPIPEAYKYRNYVIDAINEDKPYDQFVREQIAGDLMPVDDPDETWRRIIATGYIAISRRIGVSPQGQRHIMIEDTLDNLGKTFLGHRAKWQAATCPLDHRSQQSVDGAVIVNRLWHHHFGRGLVASTSDFGFRGQKPSHPELLDFLASYLIENGWSIKQLHRLIVSSRTYRLSSRFGDELADNVAIDPENIYLWRGNRRRLDAEHLRDSILVFSGQLDRSPGARHPLPHRLTYFFRQHEPYVGDFDSNRRTVYLFRQRIRKDRYLDLFDGPDGNLHVGNRRPTTTTLQSLYFMNSPFVDEQSRAIAMRLLESNETDSQRVGWMYRHIFGRDPSDDEILVVAERIERIVSQMPADSDDANLAAWASMCRAMLGSNAFLFVD